MKTDRYFASRISGTVTALIVGCVTSVLAQSEAPLASTVVRLKGHARCKAEGEATWTMIKAGDLIKPGATIQTALGAELDLLLGEETKPARGSAARADAYNPEIHPGNVVRLSADSALRIEKLARKPGEGSREPVEEIMLELRSGAMLGSVRKLGSESKYEIAFGGGVAGMRDTVYGLSAKGELSVLRGTAYVALADGKPASAVGAEQQFDPSTGSVTKLARPSRDDVRARSESDRSRPATFRPPPVSAPQRNRPFGSVRP